MRKFVIAVAILLQVAALGWIVFERESVLHGGEVVYLRTAPVDPRDIFRGDYVQLTYDINRIPVALADAGLPARDGRHKEIPVYASLAMDARGIAAITALHTEAPAEGLFLRGYTTDDWSLRGSDAEIAVRFGIEKLFVEQDAGKLIEAQRGSRNEWQRPMEVAVAVGKNGIGVIRDFRWSPFSSRLELLTPPGGNQNNVPSSPRVRFSIRNESSAALLLANPGNDCAYSLQAAAGKAFTMVDNSCVAVKVDAEDIVTLQPGDSYVRELDLSQPRWFIRQTDTQRGTLDAEIARFDAGQRFRLVYRSPSEATVWQGAIRSAAFTNRGRVD